MKRLVLMALVLGLLVACQQAPPETSLEAATAGLDRAVIANYQGRADRPRAAQGVDYVFYDDDLMKPAFDLNALSPDKALKADEYDNIRWFNPERFSITEPPKGNIRPMVEWEPMRSIVMQYPGGYSSYADVTQSFIDIAKHSLTVAEVWFIVDGQYAINTITSKLQKEGVSEEVLDTKLKFITTPIDSIWFIDSGPLPIIDVDSNTFAFSDFRYYHQRALDDGISTILGRAMPAIDQEGATAIYRMPLNTEGGTFQSTEDGICFTGNRQLFNMSCDAGSCDWTLHGSQPDYIGLEAVNNHPLADEIRETWGKYAGCVDVIVTNSISDDGTGHIDMYLKVLDETRILVGEYMAPFDALGSPSAGTNFQSLNAARMDENADYFNAYVKPDGTSLEAVRLVMPGHRSTSDGSIPFTYANSTLINGLNLWPATEYPEWEASRDVAQAQWDELLPEYDNIWIDATELSFWSGAIHCITRTVPAMPVGLWVEDSTCGEDDMCAAPTDGYSGECKPNNLATDICWGPEWECACNDCDTACDYDPGTFADQCFGISYDGCCDDDKLVYCDGGVLAGGACEDDGTCGWSSENGWYDCGFEGEDPTGAKPRSCQEVMANAKCEPVCDGKVCGDDTCNGSCGVCGANEECDEAGACISICEDACGEGDGGCYDDVAWTCIEVADACMTQVNQDCAEDGNICMSGLCVDPATVPSVDAGPTGDAASDATSPDAANPDGAHIGGDGGIGPDSPVNPGDPIPGDDPDDTVGGSGGGSSSGCQGSGGAQPPWGALMGLLGLAIFRRRF